MKRRKRLWWVLKGGFGGIVGEGGGWMDGTESMCCMTLVTAEGT